MKLLWIAAQNNTIRTNYVKAKTDNRIARVDYVKREMK